MKRDYLLFLLLHGQRLRTSPLLQQHKRIAGSPSVKRALSVAPVDGDRDGAALQEMPERQCDAADLGFFEDARGVNAVVEVTQSDQLLQQFCEIYGTAQPQDGAGELAAQMTGDKETAATQPYAAAAPGKVVGARRNGLGHSYAAKRKAGHNRNTISSSAGSVLQTGTTPVKDRQDVQEVIMNTFKDKVTSMVAMVEKQNAYLQQQNLCDQSSAVFAQAEEQLSVVMQHDNLDIFSGEWMEQ
jgi:hypothetical protein